MATSNVLQQYEYLPYPTIPVEKITPTPEQLFNYCCATAWHLKCQAMPPGNLRILDVGCGTGYKTMLLAAANPGCHVTGLDFSAQSLKVARERALVCGFPEITFHELAIDAIETLGETWDYINCQDVMYMVTDSLKALAGLRKVLSADGIIRFDFHARYSRADMLRAQAVFRMLGLMDGNPEEKEVEFVRDLMKGLRPHINLKQTAWGPGYETGEQALVLMNQLIQGDQAWSIGQVFAALAEADLEFLQMVNWPLWNVGNLFTNQIIPPEIEKRLTEFTDQQQLEFHELLHPCQRLHDLWCCKPGRVTWVTYDSWSRDQWQGAMVHLHPVLNTESFREVLSKAVAEHRVIDIRIGQDAGTPFRVDPEMAGLLLELAPGPKRVVELEEAAAGMHSWTPALALERQNWLRMILERLAEPLYVMICPPAAL